MLSFLLCIFMLWVIVSLCTNFRDLLGERGWMEESTRTKERKKQQQINESKNMLY